VVVVGTPDRDDVYDAAERAERVLGREVNIQFFEPSRWADGTEPFVRQIKSRPRVPVPMRGEPAEEAR
jgi:hypothetical protein